MILHFVVDVDNVYYYPNVGGGSVDNSIPNLHLRGSDEGINEAMLKTALR